jgi:hypothetical protein
MTGAFTFLLVRSLKNRVLARLRRLRKLPYLISVLAGLAYLGFVFLYPYYWGASPPPQNFLLPEGVGARLAESGFTLLLSGAFVLQVLRVRAESPVFNEAEVQMLFPAPVSRRALLHYHAAKAQVGILFGALVSVLIFGLRLSVWRACFLFAALWALYCFFYLGRLAVIFVKRELRERGVPAWKTRSWTAGALLVFVSSAVLWSRWFVPEAAPRGNDISNLLDWFLQISGSGPVYWATFPFRLAVRPVFAAEPARFAASFMTALVMLILIYAWILRSRVDLGPAAGGAIQQNARRSSAGRTRHRPFRLNPRGAPFMALYWKNLILAGGFRARKVWAALAAVAAVSILIRSVPGGRPALFAGSIAASLAGFLALLGPVLFREDLRTDLKNVDMLKSYPIPGWGVVLGEALAPTTVLAVLEWTLVLVAVFLLPGSEEASRGASERVAAGLSAVLVLPFVSLIGVLIQNATALILPGWVALGREHERGVEAMGQRLIVSVATVLTLLVAGLPAGIVFAGVYLAGSGAMGTAALPAASLAAALTLGAVAAAGILWLGRLFENLDAAEL